MVMTGTITFPSGNGFRVEVTVAMPDSMSVFQEEVYTKLSPSAGPGADDKARRSAFGSPIAQRALIATGADCPEKPSYSGTEETGSSMAELGICFR